jgi:membrane protein DedA with SNARE-associated domain
MELFENITTALIELIRSHGILAVIIGVFVETVIVPIPSPLIMMAAGAMLITSSSLASVLLMAIMISIVAGLTQIIGSLLLYIPSYYLGKPFIMKFEKLHGVSWDEISEFEKKFNGRGQRFTIFLLRAIPIMPLSIVSALCGLLKVNFKDYALYSFLGTILRNFCLILLGWFFKEAYVTSAMSFDNIESIIMIVIVLLIVAYVVAQKSGIIWKIRKDLLSNKGDRHKGDNIKDKPNKIKDKSNKPRFDNISNTRASAKKSNLKK